MIAFMPGAVPLAPGGPATDDTPRDQRTLGSRPARAKADCAGRWRPGKVVGSALGPEGDVVTPHGARALGRTPEGRGCVP